MTRNDAHIQDIVSRLPESPGVYQYLDQTGQVIYVGKAKNLKRRVGSYFHKEQDRYKTHLLVQHIFDIQYVVVNTEQDAFLLENNLIKKYQPHYNILLKDGKSYPSICITRETFPRIFKTRNIDKRLGDYYGPYSYSNTLDLVLDVIHKLFPIRTCNIPMNEQSILKGKYKTCLKYHLGNCCGICENKVSGEVYNQYIESAKQIIRGNAQLIKSQLEQQMLDFSYAMQYEKAAIIKAKIDLLNQFCSKTIISNSTIRVMDVFGYDETDSHVYVSMLHIYNGSIIQGKTIEYKKQIEESREEMLAVGIVELRNQLSSQATDIIVPFIPDIFDETVHIHIAISGDKKKLLDLAMHNVQQYKHDRIKQEDKLNPDQRNIRILSKLQQMLSLPTLPMHIDSFDNSNIQGAYAVAGCVVFKKGKPSKRDYKRFSIKTVEGQDDFASMREVAFRRYRDLLQNNEQLPDLIIADGGLAQMHALREATQLLEIDIPIAGLKKDNHHRTNILMYGFPPQEFGMKVTDELFQLMVKIQDEVHRFAITYHKAKRSKAQIKSELDDIQGVGEKSKQLILQTYGSIARAKSASFPELKQALGTRLATIIYNHYNGNLSR